MVHVVLILIIFLVYFVFNVKFGVPSWQFLDNIKKKILKYLACLQEGKMLEP